MRPALPLLALVTLGGCAGQAPWMQGGPQQSQVLVHDRRPFLSHNKWVWRSGPEGIVVKASRQHGTIDCQGQPIAIDGSFNHLTLVGCQRVNVDGNSNHIVGELKNAASFMISGNFNRVRWSAAAGSQVAFSDIGHENHLVRLPPKA